MKGLAGAVHRRFVPFLAAAGLAGALAFGGVALMNAPSGAATLSCPNFSDTDIPTPPPGQTGYLFIGTSITTSSSDITVTYNSGGTTGLQTVVAGTQQGSGSFHYIVNLPQDAVVTAATVTGASAQTTVTVSGCLNGPVVTTTTEPPTTTTEAPTTTAPPTTVGPSVSPSGANKGAASTQVSPAQATRPAAGAAPVTGVAPRTTG